MEKKKSRQKLEDEGPLNGLRDSLYGILLLNQGCIDQISTACRTCTSTEYSTCNTRIDSRLVLVQYKHRIAV